MFFHDVNEEDFIEILGALPHSPGVTRGHLLGAFGVIVASDDPRAWWHALLMDRGEEGAAKAVAQLIISKGGRRLLSLIRAEAAGRDVVARADDPKLARLLFDSSLEELLDDQWESSGVPADKVRGVLVAPAFSRKVLSSAAIEPRITLLRFNKVP